MTPLKFRAWDKISEKMFDVYEIDLLAKHVNLGYPSKELGQPYDKPIFMDNLVLMQSTGCKDRAGHEIFEGDILSHTNFHGIEIGRYEVRWGHFGFTMFDPTRPQITHLYAALNTVEVIDNIHENPKLLPSEVPMPDPDHVTLADPKLPLAGDKHES